MTDANEDALRTARARVKAINNPAHWRDIDAGLWDSWGAVQAALRDVLTMPDIAEGEE